MQKQLEKDSAEQEYNQLLQVQALERAENRSPAHSKLRPCSCPIEVGLAMTTSSGRAKLRLQAIAFCCSAPAERTTVCNTACPGTSIYPKYPRSTLNRYKHRGTYELGKIHSIVNECAVLHVSFPAGPDDPFPAILPMIGQMGSFEYPSADINEPLDCYLHGYVSSRIMNLARVTNGEGEGEAQSQGLPVSISAAHVDGFILSLTPNSHSYNYRSAILHGYATVVTDEAEKHWAMKLVTNGVVEDRYDHTRVPPNKVEMTSTTILRVRIVDGSGKIRDGSVSDERYDRENKELTSKVWTGVVPVWQVMGEPIPAPGNEVKEVPEHIRGFIDRVNERNKA
ncbi:flavin-nucleotide-binding protein [Histoplasma capsulatum H143]|uniref:Flavin-nucleotide-binding protein n=1 Tax=Ajellomyces capsulatus (strain H143) TaxID=544712 RepID=C6HDE0_AJECH|nr:flavin-nucleotide-binding protein [Histoplasma capsulatum H143]